MTAVHGNEPINEPSIQSLSATPQTPLAMLIPDQGTTPTSRSTERRTQADDLALARVSTLASPSSALRVISRARGKKWVIKGASGIASSVANKEPRVVNAVKSSVARAGENKAPARTF